MPSPIFSGIVRSGHFRPDDPVRMSQFMATLEEKRVRVEIRRHVAGRTMQQNKYYWAVVLGTLSEWSGHEPEELHDHFKSVFLRPEVKRLGDEAIEVYPSTTSLSIEEFTVYIDKIQRWASSQGVYIPEAGEVSL
jgi:hypothetical protein